jgi:hypothetical protein
MARTYVSPEKMDSSNESPGRLLFVNIRVARIEYFPTYQGIFRKPGGF